MHTAPAAYPQDPQVVALARVMPFTVVVPTRVPGNPAIFDASRVVPPPIIPAPGQKPPPRPTINQCTTRFGTPTNSVLNIVENDGGLNPPPEGAPDRMNVVVDNTRHLTGVAWTEGYGGSQRTPIRALYLVLGGVQVKLSSTEFPTSQLVQLAATLVPVHVTPTGSGQ